MSEEQKLAIEASQDVRNIARERILWVIRPLGGLFILLWVLNPSVTAQTDVQHEALVGFLLGAVFSIYCHKDILLHFLFSRRESVMDHRNRWPDEYFWGREDIVLFRRK